MKRILIAEDDARTAQGLTLRLTAQGYEVTTVTKASEALALARGGRFNLFILDIGLPDSDGLTLADHLQRLPQDRLAPILFLTGSRDFHCRLRATSLGAFGWLEKPYTPDDLLKAVRLALGESQLPPRERSPFSPLKLILKEGHKRHRRDRKPAPAETKPVSVATTPASTTSPTTVISNNAATAAPRPKVLVIEDDHRLAASLKVRLTKSGCETIVANDGPSGLAAAQKHHPDLILTDIRMPGGLGFSLMEHLESSGLGRVPVIYVTASRKPGLREAALKIGAADFFEKPFDPLQLMQAVRRTLRGSITAQTASSPAPGSTSDQRNERAA